MGTRERNPSDPPAGTVTFLFTDIVGSTRLWEQHPHAMRQALAHHDVLLREIIEAWGGYVFKTVGDAFCAAFADATAALAAAIATQRALHAETLGEIGPLQVRTALHTGTAEARDGDYFGPPVNRVARLLSAGHGGQILLSLATRELVTDQLPTGVELRDLGERRLKDLRRPEHVFQVMVPDLPASFPPLRTLDSRPNNLPAQPTPLVGRAEEAATVRELLLRDDVRLVTLTGAGGIGKTRLGLQVAADLIDDFENGVFLVRLAAISDPDVVAPTIAQTLGVQAAGNQSLLENLKAHLRDQQMLLLLDNFEHLAPAALLLSDLLAACPRLKFLVTSREVLWLRGEYAFPVPPLSLPDLERRPPTDRLSQYEAVELFVGLAQAARPDFKLTPENAPVVAEICVRLDGLPLAIELAAVRIRQLSPRAILAALESRLQLLTRGLQDLPARQQTLRSAVAWSYDLLDADEKALFRRLAVFAGGCTRAAVDAVYTAAGELGVDVLEGLALLTDKSLLQREEPADGEPRFVMLETLREYGLERLAESGEAEATRQAHAECYLALAEEAEQALRGSEQAIWLGRLEREHDNLRAALQWAVDGEAVDTGLQIAGALRQFWQMHGHFEEGRRWLERALSARGDVSPAMRAKALNSAGLLANLQSDYIAARTFFEESLETRRQLRDRPGMARVLNNLGMVAVHQGDYPAARISLEKSLALRRELGDRQGLSIALINLGLVSYHQGDLLTARACYEEALAIARASKDKWRIAIALMNLGEVAQDEGDHSTAATLFHESLAIRQDLGDKEGIAYVLEHLARLNMLQEQVEQAASLFGAAAALREAIDAPLPVADRARYEHDVQNLRDTLGETAFASAWAAAQAMTLKQVITWAQDNGPSA